jgi:hypothetical protein
LNCSPLPAPFGRQWCTPPSTAATLRFFTWRQQVQVDSAMLEFECVIDGIHINGVDIIRVESGQIVDFKVMVRPLKAVYKVHEQMMSMLETMKASSSG